MAIKRMPKPETAPKMKTFKRLREEEATLADRLTDLPESLQIHILSFLETKHAISTSILSKPWASTWTYVPVVSFCSNGFKKLCDFDNFVRNALSVRGVKKLDKLIFIRCGICCAKILYEVLGYAFLCGVKELEANIICSRKDKNCPIWSHMMSDSLTSLKLCSNTNIGCSFFVPRSGVLKKLTDLYLKGVTITDPDPFSGLPALKKLTLVSFHLNTYENTLNVHALQLLELSISYCHQYFNRCELVTPNLRYFECRGNNFPRLQTNGSLPVLDTVVIEYHGLRHENQRRKTFGDLMMLFDSLQNAKSLTVLSSVVQLLLCFPNKLGTGCSPFRDLKCLKLDFRRFHQQRFFEKNCRPLREVLKLIPFVEAYFLPKLNGIEYTLMYPDDDPNGEYASSNSHSSQRCG